MMLWIVFAALAAAVCLPLLLALRRPVAVGAGAERSAVDIYRDQLSELDRDVDRGVVPADEASAARTEIARRLIRADADVDVTTATRANPWLRNAAAAVILAMPVAAAVLYVVLGSPTMPDQPLAARLSAPPEKQDLAVQIAEIDQHLAQNPNDGQAWDVVAPVYARVGRFDDAVKAYANAVRLLGPTPDREVGLGLAIVFAANGSVSPDAVAAFRQAAAMAPGDVKAHYYLAHALEDQGKAAEAVTVWQEVIANAPAGAAWLPDAQAEIARLQGQPNAPAAASATATPARGPTAADVAAAQNLPLEQQKAMIEGMVSSLAQRLETNSGDAQGWAQLVRSYVVLGRPDDARAALVKAKAAVGTDPAKAAIVDEAARSAGLAP